MKEQRLNELATMGVGRLLWKYSLPSVVGMLVMSLYNVIDRIIIGQVVGSDAIAGLTITFPVMNLSAAIGVLIGAGAAARTSIMLGASNKSLAEKVLGNSLTLTISNAIIYLSLFGLFMDDLLRAFGASEVTLPYARDFMLWILPGMLVMNLAFSFNNIMRASGYPVKAMITMFIGAGMNIILAPIFVYLLDMGIKGAAIATDISMTVSACFVMIHFFRRDSILRFRRGIFRPEWKIVTAIVSIGAAPCLVNAASCFINIIINRSLLNYGGDSAVASAGIFVTYTSLLVAVVLGICQGLQPIIGYNFGANRLDRLRRAFMLAMWVSTLICTIGSVVARFFPGLIARAFTVDTALIDNVIQNLPLATSAFYVVGFQIVATTFFQSIGEAAKSVFLSLARQVIFLIPLLLLLPKAYNLQGVWISFPLSDLLATIVTLVMIVYEFRKISRRTKPLNGDLL